MENRILSACLSRGNYDICKSVLGDGWGSSFSPITKIVAEILEDFYTRDQTAQACPIEVLVDRAAKKEFAPKHFEAIKSFCAGLDGTVSVPNLVYDIRQHRRYRIGDKIAGLLANRTESRELDELIQGYQELGNESESLDTEEDTFCEVPVAELVHNHFSDAGTIPFALPRLTELCDGGFRAGHHILVYARPEIGKSLFVIDQAAYWCNLGFRVAYFENEDPIADTTMRIIGRFLSRTRDEIRRNPDKAQEALERTGYKNFIGISLAPGTYPKISKLVDKHKPDIVILNQIRNIDVGDDNRVTALEKSAVGARNLAKSRGTGVISITQAGESAEGKSFLELSDIDFSKTGIPGAIDLAIGIGATAEDQRFGFRSINLPKNKLGGRHEHFSVRFDTRTGVVEEVQR